MDFKKKRIQMKLSQNRFTDTENKLLVTRLNEGGEVNWRLGSAGTDYYINK